MLLHPRNADVPPRARTLLPPLRPRRKKRYEPTNTLSATKQRRDFIVLISQEPKKAEKRASAASAAPADGETQVKRGRGRPKGSGKKAGGAAASKAKVR